MFLLGQYFGKPETTLEEGIKRLTEHYEQLDIVNTALINRVRSMLRKGDAHQNALIVLNSFAQVLSMDQAKSMSIVSKYFRTESE